MRAIRCRNYSTKFYTVCTCMLENTIVMTSGLSKDTSKNIRSESTKIFNVRNKNSTYSGPIR